MQVPAGRQGEGKDRWTHIVLRSSILQLEDWNFESTLQRSAVSEEARNGTFCLLPHTHIHTLTHSLTHPGGWESWHTCSCICNQVHAGRRHKVRGTSYTLSVRGAVTRLCMVCKVTARTAGFMGCAVAYYMPSCDLEPRPKTTVLLWFRAVNHRGDK